VSTEIDVQAHTKEDDMQAQTTRRLQEFRFNRFIIGTLAVIGLAVASIFTIQARTGGETSIESQDLSPVNLVQEDPPLPAGWVDLYLSSGATDIYVQQDPPLPDGWVDPYFSGGTVDSYVQEDPPLPEGWVDSYFNRSVAIPEQEDPPLPEGWVDPYFEHAD
jgi:hypothetical protein